MANTVYGTIPAPTDLKPKKGKIPKFVFDEFGIQIINPEWQAQQDQKDNPEQIELDKETLDKINADLKREVTRLEEGKEIGEPTSAEQELTEQQDKENRSRELAKSRGISLEEAKLSIAREDIARAKASGGTSLSSARQEEMAQEGERLGGQVGQFQPLGVDPTSLDVGEAFVSGLVDFIPRAITGVGSLALLRGGAAAVGVGTAVRVGGALAGLNPWLGGLAVIAGITSSMISNFKSQRSDTTTAQQRVLDEGKQALQDWATKAAGDPANKARYLAGFNAQLALIDQAHRQMKLDTSRDVLKFETALPNLAEFNAFYSFQGERDVLVSDMRLAIGGQQNPDITQYRMLELTERYNGKEKNKSS